MKRLNCFLLLAASGSAIALLVFPATLAAADGKPTRIAITDPQQSAHLRAGRVCSFEFDATPCRTTSTSRRIRPTRTETSG